MLNVSKTFLSNHHHHNHHESSTTDEVPSLDTVSTSDGPISIHISSSNENSLEHVKDESKLPAVSKVHIKPDSRSSSSEEDEMTVNIYNVRKSIVTQRNTVAVDDEVMKEKQEEVKNEVKIATADEEKRIASREEIIVMRREETFIENSKSDNVTVVVADGVRKSSSSSSSSPPPEVVFLKCQKKSKITEEEKIIETPKVNGEKERSLSPVWTYTLPAPPIFADRNEQVSPTDRHNGKFYSDIISTDCHETTTVLSDGNTTILSAETHIQPVIVERKSIENVFIKSTCDNESDKSTEIITSDLEDGYLGNKGKTTVNSNFNKVDSPSPVPEIETDNLNDSKKIIEKEVIIDDFKTSRLLITRSDSFHTVELPREGPFSPPKRSTSFLSMQRSELSINRAEKIDNTPYNRRKSSSELSISDVPSLQSLEIIKNILNSSRKNSSAQDVGVVLKEEPEIESMIEREETVKQELKIVSKKLETEFNDDSKTSSTDLKTMKIEEEKVVDVAKSIQQAVTATPTITEFSEIATKKSPEIVVESVKSEIEHPKADVIVETVKLETKSVERQQQQTSPEEAPKKQTEAEKVMKRETSSINESIKVEQQSNNKPEIVAEKPKQVSEPPKQYKYSGPPKINFSTWNERPKVQIAIADDNDYKRSGTISPTPKENSQHSQHQDTNKRHTIHFGSDNKIKVQTAKPRVLGVELKKEPVVENFNKVSKTTINLKPRPINSDLNNKSPTSPDFAYNNFIHNAKKFSPIVHGFNSNSNDNSNVVDKPVERKLSPTNHNQIQVVERKSVEPPVVPLKPSFLRSSSEYVGKKNIRFSLNEESTTTNDVVFSQNSLKRTGLKDKILTDDQKKESIFGRVVEEMTVKQQELNSSRPLSIPPPPKAPPMFSKPNNNKFKKSVSMNEAVDRNQLLDAIKNFNRDSLRHK